MRFRFDTILTEEGYLDFNVFHNFDSPAGKKNIRRVRLIFISVVLLLCIAVSLVNRDDPLFATVYCVFLLSFCLFYTLSLRKFFISNLKRQIKRLEKQGKLPFGEKSTIEFYEESVVDRSASQRLEVRYDAMEKVLIVNNEYIYLHINVATAIILPIAQIRSQADIGAFLAFLKEKCQNITYL